LSTEVERADEELDRRHRAASLVVYGGVALTLVLTALALSGVATGLLEPNPPATAWLIIVVVFLGVGAIVVRRTRTNRMRLSAIAGVHGPSGLLRSLEKTSLYVALIGYAVALLAFIGSILEPMPSESRRFVLILGAIALIIFYSAYPRRAAWRRLVEAARETPAGA
jgi:hypothetical protein